MSSPALARLLHRLDRLYDPTSLTPEIRGLVFALKEGFQFDIVLGVNRKIFCIVEREYGHEVTGRLNLLLRLLDPDIVPRGALNQKSMRLGTDSPAFLRHFRSDRLFETRIVHRVGRERPGE